MITFYEQYKYIVTTIDEKDIWFCKDYNDANKTVDKLCKTYNYIKEDLTVKRRWDISK